MVQFSFIDRLGHVFGIAGDVEEFCYALAASLAAKLVDTRRPDATLIVSDHGFQGPEHTDLGCLALAGAIREMVHLPDGYTPSVLDVAPTIATFFGLTHPCEGNDLIRGGPYVTRDGEADRRERAEITKRLRELGYL